MSLSYLRDAVLKKLQERVDAATMRAINMRVNMESRADGYALSQADSLSEARAYAEAAKLVIEEYKRLTEAEKMPQTQAETANVVNVNTGKRKEATYG